MNKLPTETTTKTDTSENPFAKSVQLLYDTSKWILTVFAAVAAVLVAGLQISSIGKVESTYLLISLVAFVVALSCVGRIIWLIIRVITGNTVTPQTVTAFASQPVSINDVNLNNKDLLGGYEKVGPFMEYYEEVADKYLKAINSNDKKTVSKLKPQVIKNNEIIENLMPIARYAIALRNFHQAIRGMFFYGVITAVAIGVFAWATNQKPATITIFHEPPSAVSVILTTAGKTALENSLGSDCVAQPKISVILMDVADGKFDVVTIPTDKCKVAKFTVDGDTGLIQSPP